LAFSDVSQAFAAAQVTAMAASSQSAADRGVRPPMDKGGRASHNGGAPNR